MRKILGLDVGISSIGWALISYDESLKARIVKNGVRIFTQAEHPKTHKSLALPRREARSARRTIKRKRVRLRAIKQLFVKYLNISPKRLFEDDTIYAEPKQRDVWQLRDKALKRVLSEEEFARVLTHIAKRRGYKSNRKSFDENDKDQEKKKVLNAISGNEALLKDYQTIGQAIYQSTKDTKIRRNKQADYSHSISREMLGNEVKAIFKCQREAGNAFATEEFEKEYIAKAFYQNPFASVEKMVGICTLEEGEPRAPKRSYSAEEFVTLSKLINTKLILPDTNERYFSADELSKLMGVCLTSENRLMPPLEKP